MFLAGTSAFLMGQKKTKRELSIFLFTRGLWLIFLEISIVSFGWSFEIDVHHFSLAVIWALGACMVVLSGLIWLPYNAILIIGLILVCGHNSFDTFHVQGNTLRAFGWKLLHDEGEVTLGSINIYVMYPMLSWLGVMALGYCIGKLYASDYNERKRKKTLTLLGLSALVVFVAVRYTNAYGDIALWTSQPSNVFSILSFFNTTKYPPSLLYITMTLGPALLFLAYSENFNSRFSNIIKIYGRVPMFYYLCHLYLIHLGGFALIYIQGFTLADFDNGLPPGFGVNLGMTYAVWLAVIIILYLPCKWYDKYKSSHRENKWLSYL
jgi:uncharacterized membrane protein